MSTPTELAKQYVREMVRNAEVGADANNRTLAPFAHIVSTLAIAEQLERIAAALELRAGPEQLERIAAALELRAGPIVSTLAIAEQLERIAAALELRAGPPMGGALPAILAALTGAGKTITLHTEPPPDDAK